MPKEKNWISDLRDGYKKAYQTIDLSTPRASEEVQNARLAICIGDDEFKACPNLTKNVKGFEQCNLCGCFVRIRVIPEDLYPGKLEKDSLNLDCPKKYWPDSKKD